MNQPMTPDEEYEFYARPENQGTPGAGTPAAHGHRAGPLPTRAS